MTQQQRIWTPGQTIKPTVQKQDPTPPPMPEIPPELKEKVDAIGAQIKDLVQTDIGKIAFITNEEIRPLIIDFVNQGTSQVLMQLIGADRRRLRQAVDVVRKDRELSVKARQEKVDMPSYQLGIADVVGVISQTPPPEWKPISTMAPRQAPPTKDDKPQEASKEESVSPETEKVAEEVQAPESP